MDSTNADPQMHDRKLAPTYVRHKAIELLSILLADAAIDIDVVARDSGIYDASFMRCRRATDIDL
jgi:hypothetical protein